jgi:hypothetical protein
MTRLPAGVMRHCNSETDQAPAALMNRILAVIPYMENDKQATAISVERNNTPAPSQNLHYRHILLVGRFVWATMLLHLCPCDAGDADSMQCTLLLLCASYHTGQTITHQALQCTQRASCSGNHMSCYLSLQQPISTALFIATPHFWAAANCAAATMTFWQPSVVSALPLGGTVGLPQPSSPTPPGIDATQSPALTLATKASRCSWRNGYHRALLHIHGEEDGCHSATRLGRGLGYAGTIQGLAAVQ